MANAASVSKSVRKKTTEKESHDTNQGRTTQHTKSAASAESSLEQFGVDRRGCSGGGGDVVGGGVVAGGDGCGVGIQ